MSDAKDLLRRYLEDGLGGSSEEAIRATVAEDVVDHAGLPGAPPGIDGFLLLMQVNATAFSDFKIVVEDLIGEDDRAVARWTATATHTGELFGMPATGRSISMKGIDIARAAGGKIVEFWAEIDMAGMMGQLAG
jgi:steroid delta-isomerase-like uncharacterized protein